MPSVGSTNTPNGSISKIEILPNSTVVTLLYEKIHSNAYKPWISFSPFIYIIDRATNEKYKITSLGNNMELNTKYRITDKKGSIYTFKMIFPKLPPAIENIDIIELSPQGKGFKWQNIGIHNPDTTPKSNWTESSLKLYWQTNGSDLIEGVYENAAPSPNSPKYRIAIQKSPIGYTIIYFSGAPSIQSSKWKEGDVKGYLTPTAKDNFYKVKWILANKTVSEDLYITFDEAVMKIIWTDGSPEGLYLKLYPAISSSSKGIASSGTGFAISSDGLIVTNYHVIEGANSISVKGINNDFSSSLNAKVIVSDKNNDLAIIQIDDKNFTGLNKIPYTLKTTSSDVGENVFAMGYPLRATMGDEIKLTSGIISSKTGFQGDITSYQVSVPIQPGNSGGPLFDKSGSVIGVINAKLRGGENVSYAIKISYLKNLIELLPKVPILNTTNQLSEVSLSDQAKIFNKFVYIIETK